jgi:hypothetical protein
MVPVGLLDEVAAASLGLGMRKEEEPFEVLRDGFNLRWILLLFGGFANELLSRFIFTTTCEETFNAKAILIFKTRRPTRNIDPRNGKSQTNRFGTLKNKKISEKNPQNETRLFAVELFNKRNPQYKFLSFTRVRGGVAYASCPFS